MKNINLFCLLVLLGSNYGLIDKPKHKAVKNDVKAEISTYLLLKDKQTYDTIAITGVRMDFEFIRNRYEFKKSCAIQNNAESYCSLYILKDNPIQIQNEDVLNLTFYVQLKVPPSNTYRFDSGFSKGYSNIDKQNYGKESINVAGGGISLQCELAFNAKSMALISQNLSFVEVPSNPSDNISATDRKNQVVSLHRFTKDYIKTEIATQIIWNTVGKPSFNTGFIRN